MSETVLLVSLGAVAYTLATMALHALGLLPTWIDVRGPVTTIETRTVPAAFERLADRRRFWRRVTDAGVFVSAALIGVSFVLVILASYLAITQGTASEVNRPRNVLAVPGVNDFLPLSAAPEIVCGLFVGIAVHELSHALLARVEGVDVASMGVIFLAFVPFGAYVDMDEEERAASTNARNRIYAAGVTTNLALALGCTLLLIALVSTSIAAVSGLAVGGVVPGGPADDAGLERGDVITGIDDTAIEDEGDLEAALSGADGTVEVGRADGESAPVERSVVVAGAPEAGPNALEPGTEIDAVEGTTVRTEAELRRELEAASTATIRVTTTGGDGQEGAETLVGGAFVTGVVEDGPLAAAGAPTGEPGVVTRIDGERIATHDDLLEALGDATPGETVTVELYASGSRDEYRVTLGESADGDGAHLGVYPQAGLGGLVVTDFGVEPYPTDDHLAVLSGDEVVPVTNTPADRILGVSVLPFAGAIGLFAENFGGFVGEATSVYTVVGPLSPAGDAVFVAATVLFWTGWCNLLLGFFNCLPVYPLDGGRLLRTNVEAIASRLSASDSRDPKTAGTVAMAAVGLVVVLAVLLMLFGPMIVGG